MQTGATGVFTTAKVVDGRAHHLGLHIARLGESARIADLAAPDPEAVRREVAALLDPAQPLPHGRLRITWDGASLGASMEAMTPHPPTTTALRAPHRRDPAAPTAGAKTEELGMTGRALLAWAHEQGAGDAILATSDGRLCEGATSNVFYVIGGELCTPTAATGLLGGITRHLLLAVTDAREVDAPYEVLHRAEEIFLTSALRDVQAVTVIDGRQLGGPGPVTRAAAAALAAVPTDD